ncbi:MAG: hypothetical protein D6805_03665 [Planctomycetota bacterium]|nr:MAG: hypothetical protein D6805_03665 [Planctomycetota bacterium]
MKTLKTPHLLPKILLLLLPLHLSLTGCGENSINPGPFSTPGNTLNSGITIPQNIKPAPDLEITSPTRGSVFTTTNTITVKGTVHDSQYGVESLRVGLGLNGQYLTPAPDGSFQTQITLQPGLNIIWAVAKNKIFGRSVTAISVLYGQFQDDSQTISNAFQMHLSQSAFQKIQQALIPLLYNLDLEAKLKALNPLWADTYLSILDVSVTLETLQYSNPKIYLAPDIGKLNVWIDLENFQVSIKGNLDVFGVGIFNLTATVDATKAKANTQALASIQNGQLNISFQNTNLDLEGFNLTLQVYNWTVPSGFVDFFENGIKNVLISEVIKVLNDKVPGFLQDTFKKVYDPLSFNVLGKNINLSLQPQSAQFLTSGLSLAADANVQAGTPVKTNLHSSLITPGLPPNPDTTKEVAIALNDDFLNRILHAAWKAGILDIDINDQFFQNLGTSAPINLQASMLMSLYPEFQNHLNNNDPLTIKIRPTLPPIVQNKIGSPQTLSFKMGEVELILIAHQGALERELMRVRLQLSADIKAKIQNSKLTVESSNRPMFIGDVTAEPLVDFDQNKIETLLNVLVPIIYPQMIKTLQDIPLPSVAGVNITQFQIEHGGNSLDFLNIWGTFDVP